MSEKNQYVVLARKYRPQNFQDLMGQDALVQTLTNAIESKRLHHAYILTGIRGVGKTTTARLIARALNCIGADGNGNETINPCGICSNCTSIASGRNIDVIELDAASHTGVDDMRDLLDNSRYSPNNSRYKVYIIDEVHMLSKGAFNALLKTLEEPPAHVKFIFATTEIRKVPGTILSRCQRFDLQRISVEVLIQLFTKVLTAEQIGFDNESLEVIAKVADGSARDGLSLLDQSIALSNGDINIATVNKMLGLADRSQTIQLFQNLMKGDVEKVLEVLAEQYKNGGTPLVILQDLINITHDVAKVKIVPNMLSSTGFSELEKEVFTDLSNNSSIAVLSKIWQMLIKGISELNYAPSALSALEMILIRTAYSASLPTPYEIMQDVKKNSNSINSSQSNAEQKKNNLDVVSEKYEQLETLEDFLGYLERKKQAMLEFAIKNDVSIEQFENGKISMTVSPNIKHDFILNLHTLLTQITGKKWEIDILSGQLGQTIADKESLVVENTKKDITEYPLVKKIFEEF